MTGFRKREEHRQSRRSELTCETEASLIRTAEVDYHDQEPDLQRVLQKPGVSRSWIPCETLATIVKERFPNSVPSEIVQTINDQPSVEVLKDWIRHAIRVQTIEKFRTHLRR